MKRSVRSESDEEERSSPTKIKKVKQSASRAHMGEMAQFGAHLPDADLTRVDLERDRLQFERERLLSDRDERARKRDERHEERIEAQKLELHKFSLMTAAFTNK